MGKTKTEIFIEANEKGFAAVTAATEKLGKSMSKVIKESTTSSKAMTSELDKLRGGITALAEATTKLSQASAQSNKGMKDSMGLFRDMSWSVKSVTRDMEKLFAIQMRWYGTRMLINPIISGIEKLASIPLEGGKYAVEVDKAQAMLDRYAAMDNELTDTTRAMTKEVVTLARHLAVSVGSSFDEIMKSADRLMAAGLNIGTVKDSLKAFTQLSVSFPEINMDKFTTAVVGFLNTYRNLPGFREMSSDAERLKAILDKLVVVLAKSVLAPGDITVVIQYLGQIGSIAGFSADQLGAMSAMLANLGSKAGPAARGLRGLIVALSSEDAEKKFRRMGIELQKNISLAEQWPRIMKELSEKVGTGNETTLGQLQMLTGLTSRQQIGPLIALINQWEIYDSLVKASAESQGALSRVADRMGDSLEKMIERISNLWKELSLSTTNTAFLKDGLESILVLLKLIATAFIAVGSAVGVFHTLIASLVNILLILADGVIVVRTAIGYAFAGDFKRAAKELSDFKERVKETYTELGNMRERVKGAAANSFEAIWGIETTPTAQPAPKAGTKGTSPGLPPKPGKMFDETLIGDVKRKFNALYNAAQSEMKLHLAKTDASFKYGELSVEEHFDRKLSIIQRAETKELNILKKERSALVQAFKEIDENLVKKYSDKPDEMLKAREQNQRRKESELEALKTKELQTKGKIDLREIQTDVEKNEILRRQAKQRFADEKAMAQENFRSIDMLASDSVSRRRDLNEWLYAQNRVSATEYYAEAKTLIEKQYSIDKERIKESYENEKNRLTNMLAFGKLTVEESENVNKQILLLEKKFKNDMTAEDLKYFNNLNGFMQKKMVDYRALWEGDDGFAAVTKRAFEEIEGDLMNHGLNYAKIWKGIASSLTDVWQEYFNDAIEGKMKSLGDYLQSFTKAVAKSIMNILAQETSGAMMSGGKALFGLIANAISGISFGGSSGGGTPITGGYQAATGGVFARGNLIPFAKGGVVYSPTVFPMARGTGLMGEAGPEAVLPLKQAPGGNLGVSASGAIPNVIVNVINQTSRDVTAKQQGSEMTPAGMVTSIVLQDLNNGGPIARTLRR